MAMLIRSRTSGILVTGMSRLEEKLRDSFDKHFNRVFEDTHFTFWGEPLCEQARLVSRYGGRGVNGERVRHFGAVYVVTCEDCKKHWNFKRAAERWIKKGREAYGDKFDTMGVLDEKAAN